LIVSIANNFFIITALISHALSYSLDSATSVIYSTKKNELQMSIPSQVAFVCHKFEVSIPEGLHLGRSRVSIAGILE
jgi:hypothetical protein